MMGGDLRPRGYAYRNYYDFVLQHGLWYAPAVGVDAWRGLPRMCFGNAIEAAATRGWAYVEGYAYGLAGMAVHHAWCCEAGELREVTWESRGPAYLGVVFSVERAHDATMRGDATVLDDFKRRWPVFREPWQGEPAGRVWPPSAALDAWRSGDVSKARRLLAIELRAERRVRRS